MEMAGEGTVVDDIYVLQANLDNITSKIVELEGRIENQEQEVSRLELLDIESERFQSMESELERASGLEILSLTPEDVPYEDLVAKAKALSTFHVALLLENGGEGWSEQISILISRIRHRTYANALRTAALSVSAKDPRYKLKYSPEVNLIIATLPGQVTANIAAPSGWPMPGFTLHLRSLVPADKASNLNPLGILQQCVDLANSCPKSLKSDMQFLGEIEKIYVAKKREAMNQQ